MKIFTLLSTLLALGLFACGGNSAGSESAEPATTASAATESTEAPDPEGIPERGDDTERASKNGETVMTSGSLTVTVRYGRPKVNGRTIFGELVPFDTIWRTGANEATTITLSEAATFGDTAVEAGTYALFAIPGQQEWIWILNRDAQQWGASRYDEGRDAARAHTAPVEAEATEEMTFADEGGSLALRWANLRIPVPLRAN